ncbi:MAG: hypothetical protein ACFE9T_05755 [Promethearchaeota archaeon]
MSCFQVYSHSAQNALDFMVDKIWIKEHRIFFRVVEKIPSGEFHFRKEKRNNIYSIHENDLFSIRCRLYF